MVPAYLHQARAVMRLSLLTLMALAAAATPVTANDPPLPNTEFLPILSYDTDAGLGYGLKFFAVGHLGMRESFDLILFNSTRGERWYRLVFSLPDFELRQGTQYAAAVDLTVDYDKWISNNFFGVGNRAPFDARETYTREPFEVTVVASRGFSTVLVGQAGVRWWWVQNSNFEPESVLPSLPPAVNAGKATSLSLTASFRWDTRNSFVDPSAGLVLQADMEVAPRLGWTTTAFSRFGGTAQWYQPLFDTSAVLALRFLGQGIAGDDIPVQMMLPIGGNRTVRGLVQDRYLDRVSAVANMEIRFPIWWRLRGVAGIDAGKVWHLPGEIDLVRWPVCAVVGLRLAMDTFIVRLDLGFSNESTGFYLNFGQLF